MFLYFEKFILFSSRKRRLLLFLIDLLVIIFSIWLSFWLRLGENASGRLLESLWLIPTVIFVATIVYALTGQYRALTKHLGSNAIYMISFRNLVVLLIVYFFGLLNKYQMPPRSSWILIWILLSSFIGGLRFILRDLLLNRNKKNSNINNKKDNIVIYGAGTIGAQLSSVIQKEDIANIIYFVDDSPLLIGRTIDGISIKSPNSIKKDKKKIHKILLAISTITNSKRSSLLKKIRSYEIPIQIMPSIEDIISRKVELRPLKNIIIDDLLGRDKVIPNQKLLIDGIKDKAILVTGAGGSIGSELCIQLTKLSPSKIILLELSEHALYQIERELSENEEYSSIDFKGYLGNCCDEPLLKNIFEKEFIDIVFHAAAYKHVPIVEVNPLIGIRNNVFSTKSICKIAKMSKVSNVVLISTDKAVRPTNIMGASKRLAELVVQGYAEEVRNEEKKGESITKFSMVRFGNVLNSSGSVVPIFKEQISKGGPITITHPNIIRYFMTIEEASHLVIQSANLSLGGDLFVLDMGQPIKITELAKQMISLSGLTIKNSKNPEGDIEITYTGLRPGEKLFEEILIDAECLNTSHPLIFRAIENSINPILLWEKLEQLKKNIDDFQFKKSISLLSELVPEWQQQNY